MVGHQNVALFPRPMMILFEFIIFVATLEVSSLPLEELFSNIALAAGNPRLLLLGPRIILRRKPLCSFPNEKESSIAFVESSTLGPLRTTYPHYKIDVKTRCHVLCSTTRRFVNT